jgi:transcriptional regulator with XRE-family HTH domain
MSNINEIQAVESVSREERVIASKLFRMRTRMGIEREDLAVMVGIRELDLAEYENGLEAVPASDLFMLATVMGINVTYFYGEAQIGVSAAKEEARVLLS